MARPLKKKEHRMEAVIACRISSDVDQKVRSLADIERRTLGTMAGILIKEAVDARHKS